MKTILKNKSNQQLLGEVPNTSQSNLQVPSSSSRALKSNNFGQFLSKGWSYMKLFSNRIEDYITEAYRSPTVKSSAIMALGLCFTFVGYEYSRAASITLLAAEETGLGSEALPLTVAVGFPASALVLYLYTKSIKKFGAKVTLRFSNLACISIFLLVFLFCGKVSGIRGKALVVTFYAFREIYVSLLSSQQWAFISTTLDRTTSSYLVSFSGIVSIASAVGGCTVVQLVNVGGVRGLLLTTLIAVILGLICAEVAHNIADRAAETPSSAEKVEGSKTSSSSHHSSSSSFSSSAAASQSVPSSSSSPIPSTSPAATPTSEKVKTGFWSDSFNLIQKTPILQILFYEAVTHQFCSNMLNLMFHNGLRQSTEVNEIKAKMVGRFFATVNVSASILQCLFFPLILSPATLPIVMRYLPFIVLLAVLLGVIYPGTISVMLGFGTIKILEYSCMHTASEMIYMPLGREIRYVGKELIKFFGQKLGKSVAALSLSIMVNRLELSLRMQSFMGAVLTIVWGYTIFKLSAYLVQREQLHHVTFREDVVDGHSGTATGRIRTKSEELRLSTSRSIPLFELPEDEEEEALFFRHVPSGEEDQPEDFFYGSLQENSSDEGEPIRQSIIAAEVEDLAPVSTPTRRDQGNEEQSYSFANHISTPYPSLRRRQRKSLQEYNDEDEDHEEEMGRDEKMIDLETVSNDYLSQVLGNLQSTPVISMFLPSKIINTTHKYQD